MECPIDASRHRTLKQHRCGAEKVVGMTTYICTRERGHTHSHHAHDWDDNCLLVWNTQEDSYFFSNGDILDTELVKKVIENISAHFKYVGRSGKGEVPAKIRCVKNLELIVKG